ncbi:MAG: SUMF1/EgtB/PvdO family nonheme iron enzyme, partial [Planctomycetes bacterium]|nr:SUMF1/EgtB/PvdO family nonheme iron enzyme [Planctomycetota bacterium]
MLRLNSRPGKRSKAVIGFALGCLCCVILSRPSAAQSAKEDVERSKTPPIAWMLKPSEVPDAAASDEAEMKPYKEKISGTDVTFELVPIKGGTFKIGSPAEEADRKDDEGPQIDVEIEPFWMGKYEVTWDEYELWGMGLDQQRRKI